MLPTKAEESPLQTQQMEFTETMQNSRLKEPELARILIWNVLLRDLPGNVQCRERINLSVSKTEGMYVEVCAWLEVVE